MVVVGTGGSSGNSSKTLVTHTRSAIAFELKVSAVTALAVVERLCTMVSVLLT